MRIRKYGITLARISHPRIELVRQWRNAPHIRSFMEFREPITPSMQEQWFTQLDPLRDFYFIIEYHDEPVGLIHTSGINWMEKSGHSGLFIYKQQLLGTHVPVLASLSMVDFFFHCCSLETLNAKVMEENPVAIKYNAQLGFKPAEPAAGKRFRHYSLTKEHYAASTSRLHLLTKSLHEEAAWVEIERHLYEQLTALGALRTNAFPEKIMLTD